MARRPTATGFFYPPTVLVGVPADSAINREEIFGPVAPVTTFETEDEAIERANDTEYGLASYVFTRDLARTIRLAEALDFGMVGVNTGLVSNAGGAVRRREGQRVRPRGRLRGHRGVPRDDLRALPASDAEPYLREPSARSTASSPPRRRRLGLLRGVGRGRRGRPRGAAWIDSLPGSSSSPTWSSPPPGGTASRHPGRTPACATPCSPTTARIRATIMARATQTNEVGRLATLVPAFALLAHGGPSPCWRRARAPG